MVCYVHHCYLHLSLPVFLFSYSWLFSLPSCCYFAAGLSPTFFLLVFFSSFASCGRNFGLSKIDGVHLLELTQEDMKSLGLKHLSDRRRLGNEIDLLRRLNLQIITGPRDIFLSYAHVNVRRISRKETKKRRRRKEEEEEEEERGDRRNNCKRARAARAHTHTHTHTHKKKLQSKSQQASTKCRVFITSSSFFLFLFFLFSFFICLFVLPRQFNFNCFSDCVCAQVE